MVQQVLIKRTGVDNKPPTGLSPGELAVEMGNPSRLWVGVPTANDASGMKLLNNSAIKSATAPVPATEGQLWFDNTTLYIHSAGVWVPINVPAAAEQPLFNGYLHAGANLALKRENGIYTYINGRNEVIPAGGVFLAATGLSDVGGFAGGRCYYIYAFMNGTTMTMEAVVTGYEFDPTPGRFGHKVKIGDPTRTLVGMALVESGGNAWYAGVLGAANYYNAKPRTYYGYSPNQTNFSNTYISELVPGSSIRFCSFDLRDITISYFVNNMYQSVATNDIYLDVWVDNAAVAAGSFFEFETTNRFYGTAGSDHRSASATRTKWLTEGAHAAGLLAWVSGGTGTINRAQWQVTIQG